MTPEYLLVVDGYNVINAWPELRELGNLKHARIRLVELLVQIRGHGVAGCNLLRFGFA